MFTNFCMVSILRQRYLKCVHERVRYLRKLTIRVRRRGSLNALWTEKLALESLSIGNEYVKTALTSLLDFNQNFGDMEKFTIVLALDGCMWTMTYSLLWTKDIMPAEMGWRRLYLLAFTAVISYYSCTALCWDYARHQKAIQCLPREVNIDSRKCEWLVFKERWKTFCWTAQQRILKIYFCQVLRRVFGSENRVGWSAYNARKHGSAVSFELKLVVRPQVYLVSSIH